MARSRRTRFAASFVAVIAGCSHEHPGTGTGSGTGSASASGSDTPRSSWSVTKGGDGACWAMPHVDCSHAPPGVTCNPPAGMRVGCPEPMPADGFQIVSFDGTTCFAIGADGQTRTPTTCPTYDEKPPSPSPTPDAAPPAPDAATFHPRSWEIIAGDKSCAAELNGFTCPPGATCNPPAPTKVTCPPFNPGNHVEEIAPGKCYMLLTMGGGNCPPNIHCNPPAPRHVDVPCPGDK